MLLLLLIILGWLTKLLLLDVEVLPEHGINVLILALIFLLRGDWFKVHFILMVFMLFRLLMLTDLVGL